MFNPEACDLKPQQNAMVTVSPMIAKPNKIRVKFRRPKRGKQLPTCGVLDRGEHLGRKVDGHGWYLAMK